MLNKQKKIFVTVLSSYNTVSLYIFFLNSNDGFSRFLFYSSSQIVKQEFPILIKFFNRK